MLDADIFMTGLTTMLVGMGVVFLFLIILVFAMMIMTKCVMLVDKIWPAPKEEPKGAKKAKTAGDDSEVALAIAIAKAQA